MPSSAMSSCVIAAGSFGFATRPPEAVASAPGPLVCQDDPSVIDLMVLYTPLAKSANVTEAHTLARVNQAVKDTNTAFVDSQVNVQIRLVHAEEVAYAGDASPLD